MAQSTGKEWNMDVPGIPRVSHKISFSSCKNILNMGYVKDGSNRVKADHLVRFFTFKVEAVP